MGGIATAEDAIEMMMAGAKAVQIGTILFNNPYAAVEIVDGMNRWCDENNIKSISEISGTVEKW